MSSASKGKTKIMIKVDRSTMTWKEENAAIGIKTMSTKYLFLSVKAAACESMLVFSRLVSGIVSLSISSLCLN